MTQKDNGGPAFPALQPTGVIVKGAVETSGMSLRAYAAIHLQQPDSGIDWLDAMILSAKRDAIAEQALVRLSRGCAIGVYDMADALLAERGK